jgi:hypothetical protein
MHLGMTPKRLVSRERSVEPEWPPSCQLGSPFPACCRTGLQFSNPAKPRRNVPERIEPNRRLDFAVLGKQASRRSS